MKLNEIRKVNGSSMPINFIPSTRDEVELWLKEHVGMIKHWITPELEVDVLDLRDTRNRLNLQGKKIKGKIPVKFRKINGEFNVQYNSGLASLENFPAECYSIDISSTKITSLVGINDIVKKLTHPHEAGRRIEFARCNIKRGGIGLLLIDGLTGFNANQVTMTQTGPQWTRAEPFSIIEKYIGRPDDIFECQAELIDNGFEEFAIL